ncbi:MAG: adenylate/guanylate cyclase domain-containing protein [Microscillaceae bacterium]|nr:adenylate/guanylate cyclase domain-containing protein [Microscillaceae bacterium]
MNIDPIILIIEDEENNQDTICEYLSDKNPEYQLLRAFHGKQALEIMMETLPDIILLDWRMPVMDGMETLQVLKADKRTRSIPVIMVTGETQPQQLELAFERGVIDYITKPINGLELYSRVRSALFLSRSQKKTEELLLNILPADVADELKESDHVTPKAYDLVSVMFIDFKGFSRITKNMPPIEIIKRLEDVFSILEEITSKYRLEKIKTIGDAYMCAGGIPVANQTNPFDTILAALEVQKYMQDYKNKMIEKDEPYFEYRLGIHTGKVVAGVIGKKKFAYDIWGSSVNVASRMESNGEAGRINVSGDTYQIVKRVFECEYRGKIPIKNLDEIDMYFVNRIKPEYAADGSGMTPDQSFWEFVRG